MLLVITGVMALMYGYIQWFFLSVLALPIWMRMIFSAFIGMGIFNVYVVLRMGYVMPPFLIKCFAFSHLLMIYLFFATLIFMLLKLVHITISPNGFLITALILTLTAGIGIYRSGMLPNVENVEIKSALLPKSWKPLTFIQLTDLHIGQGFDEKWLEGVVKKVNMLSADFVLITGDSIDQVVHVLENQMMPLKHINKPIYMVFGNHEHYYQPNQWEKAFSDMGIIVLNNMAETVHYAGNTFVLAGVDYGPHFNKNNDLITPVFKDIPADLPRILMAHHPHSFIFAPENNVVLQLSGHTHGGMTVPISFIVKLYNNGFLRGLYTDKSGSKLYVSDGTGLWGGMPARVGTTNEITRITLSRED